MNGKVSIDQERAIFRRRYCEQASVIVVLLACLPDRSRILESSLAVAAVAERFIF